MALGTFGICVVGLQVLSFVGVCVSDKVCRIDPSIDFREDPENVYNCKDLQTCCLEEGKPSCCVDKDLDGEVVDQVKLWAGVIGAALAVGILICCCRRDGGCCEGDEPCSHYMSCGCCKSEKLQDEVDYEQFQSSPSHVSTIYCEQDDVLPSFVHEENPEKCTDKIQTPHLNTVGELQAIQAHNLMQRLEAN